ncbi:hypothetical protein Ancab_020450 [Ancistrocladus abbreviatus]
MSWQLNYANIITLTGPYCRAFCSDELHVSFQLMLNKEESDYPILKLGLVSAGPDSKSLLNRGCYKFISLRSLFPSKDQPGV